MQHSGFLVMAWPTILGCDASGVVLETGPDCKKLKVGDRVFGCTRVGQYPYSTFQETHLMDEDLTYKTPDNVSTDAASTMGVGLDVCLGQWEGRISCGSLLS
jgi:NADPH:quinone reductase-like Zn-dependent oxidoreductase